VAAMLSKLRALWLRFSTVVWAALVLIGGVLVATCAAFYRGRAQGDSEGRAASDIRSVREAEETGDDAGVLRFWRRSREDK
jgi:hypothetical protein